MVQHVLAWQSTSITDAPVVGEGMSVVDRAHRPIAHKTDQRRLRGLLAQGDSIWIVGRYRSLSNAAASIIGRIIISEKRESGKSTTFAAAPESYWLPWNDAYDLLHQVELKGKRGSAFLMPEVDPAQQLQTTRQVAASSHDLLASFADDLRRRLSVFVSYSWSSSADLMPHLLPALAGAGCSIWIDRWSGPRRFKEDGKSQPNEIVEQLLADAIHKTDLVIAVIAATYETGLWTTYEASTARNKNKSVIQIPDQLLRQHIERGDLNSFVKETIAAWQAGRWSFSLPT